MNRKDLLNTLQNELRREKQIGNRRKEIISKYDATLYNNTVESALYVQKYQEFTERFVPEIRVRHPETFAFYGSAEKYYDSAFKYIYSSYPYDGSGLEKLEWSLSASALDLAVLQHEYPKETGFVTFTPVSWGSVSATSGRYALTDDPEYISFSGGPYVGSLFDSAKKRESSLKIDGQPGNTLEFWLKKDSFVSSSTKTEVIFDSHTKNNAEGTSGYGRFLLELSSSSGSPFYLTYMSGTAGMDRVQLGSSITDNTVADGNWHHYAFAINHSGSDLVADMYVDGAHNSTTKTSAATFGAVADYFKGTIGALATQKDSSGGLGYGKLSGSLDEVRFWKVKRTAKDIGNHFDFPVNGATDSETINSSLGLYYKFNEGTVSNTTQDKVILDYSGRLNNGEFNGYAASNRNSGSAISQSTASEETELGDPIINSSSSRVTTALDSLIKIAKEYDKLNNASIFKSVPQWAYEPGAGSNNLDSDFSILLQAMASRFDSIKLLVDQIPKITRKKYDDFHFAKGSIAYHPELYVLLGCEREFTQKFASFGNVEVFSYANLLARNFDVKEMPIINKLSLDEYFYNLKFSQTDEVSNLGSFLNLSKGKQVSDKIMNSIYYDIDAIYKKKGTQSAFRNLIRCFGVDEKLVTPNIYVNNGEVLLKDNPIQEEVTIKSLEVLNNNSSTTLFQTASSSEERHYIQGKNSGSMSFEVRTIFPNTDSYTTDDVETSVFGCNEVATSSISAASPNQAAFVVTSVKDGRAYKGSRFKISSSAGMFTSVTSDYFPEVFDNTPWHLSVRFSEDTSVPLANLNNKSTKSYKVEFSGYQYELDTLISSFNISSSITETNYLNFIQANKSTFIGAQRSGITGSVQKESENKFLSFTVWDDRLSNTEIKEHAKSTDNIGRFMAFSETDDNDGDSRLKIDTLVLNWQFDDTTMSGTTVSVVDHASGSVGKVRDFGNIVGYKYPASTVGVAITADIIDTEHIYHTKYMPIDNVVGESKIEIKDREIDLFEIDSRPITYIYSYEKSAYQIMSRQMLRMIAGASAFNNLIGEPIYKYRERYKSLDNIREKFFSRIENDIDLERFIEYYKWVDSSLGKMLEQLQPATSEMKIGMEDVIESHAFERNKYKHQAPVFEFKDPDPNTNILGINELLYDWEHGHAPIRSSVYWAAFDGTDDFIDVPDHDDLSFGNSATDSPFSISVWAVFTNPTTSQQGIVGKFNANTNSEYLVWNNFGFLQFNIYDQNTSNRIQSKTDSSVFVDGALYNITVTYDGSGNFSGINIYIDGVLVPQTRSSNGTYTAMHNTNVNFQIGSTVAGTLDFARNMRHVMVFDDELGSSDVTQLLGLYDKGQLNVTATTLTKYANIVSWWKLNGDDLGSSTATDSIGGHDGTFNGDAEIVLEKIITNQAENCLWWKDRAERDGILAVSGAPNADRETLKTRANTFVEGSTYVIRKLSRPYRFAVERSNIISLGSNRNANKNKDLYKVIHSGKEITLNKSDIYEFKRCDDVINPQEEDVYTAKVDVDGTSGYLDADADMLLPFSLYSSSVGNDFSNFKDNLSITNNHDDHMPSLQGPFVRENVGGMPHRRVKYLTPDVDRAEAYFISASATTLTVKQPTGLKSIWSRGRENSLNIANIKTNTSSTPVVVGNYDKVYEIVQAHGRSINNRLLADSGSIPIEPISVGRISGTIDYTVPTRQKSEHVFVSRFSSPGGPETMAHGARDLESGEFSIYNSMNYRNLSVRDPLNRLHTERSEKLGYRSGSATQASVHMTNRNYFYTRDLTSGESEISLETTNFNTATTGALPAGWISNASDETPADGPVVKKHSAGFPDLRALVLVGDYDVTSGSSGTEVPGAPGLTGSSTDNYRWVQYPESFSKNKIRVKFKASEGDLMNGYYGLSDPPQADFNYLWLQYKAGVSGSWITAGDPLNPGDKGEVASAGAWDFTNTVTRDIYNPSYPNGGNPTPIYLRWISYTNDSTRSSFDRWGIDDIEILEVIPASKRAKDPDNFYIQHPIPQNDMQYAWITASSDTTAFEFVEANDGFGHQHSFTTGSKSAIQFISSSTYQNPTLQMQFIATSSFSTLGAGKALQIFQDRAYISIDQANSDKGQVEIFQLQGSQWVKEITLQADNPTVDDGFGGRIAGTNDILAVAAPGRDTDGLTANGVIYIYERRGESPWSLSATISGSATGDNIGILSIDGDNLVVSSHTIGGNFKGGANVYNRKLGWAQTAQLTSSATVPANFNTYGRSNDISGKYIVVGADLSAAGYAVVFEERGENNWIPIQTLTPSDGQNNDQFGYSVAIDGDLIAIGSYSAPAGAGQGAVYIFEKQPSGTWAETQKITLEGAVNGDQFGENLSIKNGYIFAAAAERDTTGQVFVLGKTSGEWKVVKIIDPKDYNLVTESQNVRRFGEHFSAHGDSIIIGAPYSNLNSLTNNGAAYIFRKVGKSWADVDVNYAGVNLSIVDGVDEDTNTLAKVTDATAGQLINHRQGPYGWPTWKQIRGYEHPIARAHKKSNTFSRVYMGKPRKLDNFNKKAVTFNGTDSYLQINSTRTIFAGDQFSVFTWIKHPEITLSTSHTILGINPSSGLNRVALAIKGSGSQGGFTAPGALALFRVGDSWQRSSHVRIDDNEWHQVGLVYEKLSDTIATIEFYVDGVSQGTKINITPFTHIDGDTDLISIGAEFDPDGGDADTDPDPSDFFNGQIADFIIWDQALTDTQAANLVKYSGLDSRSKGPIDIRERTDIPRAVVWYRMGDGNKFPTGRKDQITLTAGSGEHNIIFNNQSELYNATPVGTSMTINDVSLSLPGDYFVLTEQTIIQGSQDVGMNVGYSLGLDRSDDPYERARNLDTAGVDSGPTYEDTRVIKNYQEPPVTNKYSPISITMHGDLSYTPELLNSFSGGWERGFDPRLPRFFTKRENTEKLDQLQRERSWNLDNKYYENITNNISLSEREQLGNLGKYSISYGQVNIKKTFGNDIVTFANEQILKDSLTKEPIVGEAVPFLSLLIDENDAEHHKLIEVSYIESLYPREVNIFSKNARARFNFDFFGWKSSRSDREITLVGNIEHKPDEPLLADSGVSAFPKTISKNTKDYKKSFFGLFDAVDVSSYSIGNINIASQITASSWVLDSRKDLTVYPTNITSSFINQSSSFLAARDQGTRGEGLLQNDFSTFPLGYNGLNATPPFSLVYNRRIPQTIKTVKDNVSNAALPAAHFGTFEGDSTNYPYRQTNDLDITIGTTGITHDPGSAYLTILVGTNAASPAADGTLRILRKFPGGTELSIFFWTTRADIIAGTPNRMEDTSTDDLYVEYSPVSDFSSGVVTVTEEFKKSSTTSTGSLTDCANSAAGVLHYNDIPGDTTLHYFQIDITVPVSGGYYRIRKDSDKASGTPSVHGDYLPIYEFGYRVEKPDIYLAGEAKWEAASGSLGPFYNSYADYAYNDLRPIAKDHSIVPEFRMSQFVEEVLNGDRPYPDRRDLENPLSYWSDFLSLTGSIYTDEEGNLEISGQAFKTYSNSDFLRYFEVIDDEVVNNEHPISPARLTLKCKAAMKFLPYRGFYPAERVTQIYELFHKNYLSEDVLQKARVRVDAPETEAQVRRYLNLRANASRYQVSKTLFGPGVLMNSIKSGVAVDYPIFTGSFHDVRNNLPTGSVLTGAWPTGDDLLIPSNTTFTGSAINNTHANDLGIPRIKSTVNTRVEFEDLLNPSNIYNIDVFDNEPHPSASLQYGSQKWNRIIERPAKFGTFEKSTLFDDLGVDFSNNRKDFANQIAPYTLAMQNFAAETVNFFVEDGHLTTVMSKPIDEPFIKDEVYKMRVRISNNNNVMYDRPSAFGPPVDDSGTGLNLIKLTPTINTNPESQLVLEPGDFGDSGGETIDQLGLMVFQNVSNSDNPQLDPDSVEKPSTWVYFYSSQVTGPLADYDDDDDQRDYVFIDLGDQSYDLGDAEDDKITLAYQMRNGLRDTEYFSQYYDVEVNAENNIVITGKFEGETATSITGCIPPLDSSSNILFDIFDGASAGAHPSLFANSAGTPDTGSMGPSFTQGTELASYYTKSTVASTSSHGFAPYVPPFLDPDSDPYVEITFTPTADTGGSRNYTAQEIIDASTFEYYNFNEVPNNSSTNTNYKESMSLSASLNLGICATLRTDNIETLADGTAFISDIEQPEGLRYETDIKVDGNKKLDRWVIQTKWETPVMDFSNVSASALNLSTGQEQIVSGSPWKNRYWDAYYTVGEQKQGVTPGSFMTGSTGMWHQKGEVLTNQDTNGQKKGYYLVVEDAPTGRPLATKLGFINYREENDTVKSLKKAKEYRSRIGMVEDRKMIKEAVVAIPYVLREDLPANSPNKIEFIKFNRRLYSQAANTYVSIDKELKNIPLSDQISSVEEYRDFLRNYNEKTRSFISDSPLNAIEYQLFMMKDYILPPALDFRITGNDPFMMYFFQFRASLNQTDIANIWQNLYPESPTSMANARYSCADREYEGRVGRMGDVSYVSHYLDTISLIDENYCPADSPYDLFSPRNTDNKTRWLVFKVKERGKTNLEDIRKSSLDPRISNVEKFEYIKEGKTSKSSETLDVEKPTSRAFLGNTLQFNWPYDYFSFVELIKLDAKVDSYTYKKTE